MLRAIPNIDPVAIAIDSVCIGPTLEIRGIDLETGLRVGVVVHRPDVDPTTAQRPVQYEGCGLVLTLTIEAIIPTN